MSLRTLLKYDIFKPSLMSSSTRKKRAQLKNEYERKRKIENQN